MKLFKEAEHHLVYQEEYGNGYECVQCQERVYREHYDEHRDELYGVCYEEGETVNEEPVYRGRIVVDLCHESACLAA